MRSPTQALIVRFLEDEGPMTSDEIAALVGITRRNVNRALAIMLACPPSARLVHIAAWLRLDRGLYGSVPIPQYKAGRGRDAPRPAPKTSGQAVAERSMRRNAPERLFAKALRVERKPR